eukprot:s408_g4.t3
MSGKDANERRAAMQEAVPGACEVQRHRLIFFTWNAAHLTRSRSEPFSGTRTHSLLMDYLSVASSCSVGCAATDSVEVFGVNLALGAILSDGAELVKEDCPGNKVGSYTVQCNIGVPSVTTNACVPPPCPAGSSVALALDDQTLTHSSQLEHVHGHSYTLPCENVNANYYGNLQIYCQAATLMANLSTCLGNPCSSSAALEVAVGWRSASLSPSSEEAHGNTWTANCFSINEEFSGDVTLTCNFGNVSAITSGCTQMEVGCRPSGQDRSDTVTVESYTQALQPSSTVQQGGTWSYDCSSFTAGTYEGSVSVTCGALGAYSIDNGCTAKNCLAGSSFSASKSGFSGQTTLSSDIQHGSTGTASCANVNQALRGNVQLSCSYGVLSIDASACYAICTDSAQAIFGGSVHTVSPSEEIADGNSFSVPCVNYLSGWEGNVVATCTTGSLSADASGCTGLPCEVGNSVSITLYDVTQSVALTEDLAHEASTSRACSSINADYAGNFQLQCLADVLQLDKSGCTCQTEACSTAPCPSGDTFVVALTGVQSPVPLTQTLQALESTNMSCDSAAPGHDGSLSVLCSGGVLSADVSACAPRSCDASTAAAAATVGSMNGPISATQVQTDTPIWGQPIHSRLCHWISPASRCVICLCAAVGLGWYVAVGSVAIHRGPMTTESTREALKFTRMCKYWGSRTCFNGMGCPFAHSESELCEQPDLQATGLCYEFARSGHCRRGQGCNFAHGKHELRLPRAKKVASWTSVCGRPQNTQLDSQAVQGMVNQLRELEEMVVMLELQIAALQTGHGRDYASPSPGASPSTSSARRSESDPGRMWL